MAKKIQVSAPAVVRQIFRKRSSAPWTPHGRCLLCYCAGNVFTLVSLSFLHLQRCLFTVADGNHVNSSLSGRSCQRWDSQSPHMHPYSNLSAYENYCMNPNEDAAPWCYTTDTHRRTEYCLRPLSYGTLFCFLFSQINPHICKTVQNRTHQDRY